MNSPDPISALTELEISSRLANKRPSRLIERFPIEMMEGETKPAAVLIPLLKRDASWHVLFTRRTDTLPEHSGQVAFPGGRADPDDGTPEVTALREAEEEIGLKPDDVNLLGRLDPMTTISNYRLTPVVGVMPWPYPIRLARHEVSRVFTIPLEWLANAANREIQERELPDPYGSVPVIYFSRFEDELLWGVSAQITLNLLDALDLS